MRIVLNGKDTDVDDATVFSLLGRIKPGGYATVDGYGISEDMPLKEGMSVCLFLKDEVPSEEEADALLSARDTPGVREKLKRARVGIAGLGGLGSNVAVLLARAGVGNLLLADSDTVDVTNLNRQDYSVSDIGKRKTDAMRERVLSVSPYVRVETFFGRIVPDNAAEVFSGCDIVVEAFDRAEDKAALIDTLLSKTGITVVSGNGVAGIGPANTVVTTAPMEWLVMCGDGSTEARPGCGLSAPHVMIASAHQANAVVRILQGLDPVQ